LKNIFFIILAIHSSANISFHNQSSHKNPFYSPFQCYAEKQALGEVSQELLDTQVNPAVWEISGHIVLKRRNDYDEASEASAWGLLAEVSLSEERFDEVKAYIFDATGLVETKGEVPEADKKEAKDEKFEGKVVEPMVIPHFQESCLVLQ
jgi:GDP-L-galactose phosphorylase